ncbi:cobalamin-dependent protein [Rhodococcus sp. PvR099]|jgi:methylaspartate mutase sigma subunit|uniref:cobalamin-dependent protein n=1 Tax=Rhodococcus sp. PvR099 TaxID=2806602 RepID=UPI001AE5F8BA|nr:cobalamin-dependent protein [Rhodococcus sp. PvR099]MBP1161549.1 methylaspartate mutase sigma subunit [Rhodococcus sp. PvR099]
MLTPKTSRRTVILGVAASDAHAVANHLIAHELDECGYYVVNLGVCTPIAEFAAAAREHPRAVAILIGSLNGHAHEDLRELAKVKEVGEITCPVIVGGNLSVGSAKSADSVERLYALGVDYVLDDASQIVGLLTQLCEEATGSVRNVS